MPLAVIAGWGDSWAAAKERRKASDRPLGCPLPLSCLSPNNSVSPCLFGLRAAHLLRRWPDAKQDNALNESKCWCVRGATNPSDVSESKDEWRDRMANGNGKGSRANPVTESLQQLLVESLETHHLWPDQTQFGSSCLQWIVWSVMLWLKRKTRRKHFNNKIRVTEQVWGFVLNEDFSYRIKVNHIIIQRSTSTSCSAMVASAFKNGKRSILIDREYHYKCSQHNSNITTLISIDVDTVTSRSATCFLVFPVLNSQNQD